MSFLPSVLQILPSVASLLSPSSTNPTPQIPPFSPTYKTIRQTRALLKSLNLPTELVLAILDDAEYWPCVSFTTQKPPLDPRQPNRQLPTTARATGRNSIAAAICLATPDVYDADVVRGMGSGGETPRVRRVEFKLKSRDQGWTSEGGKGGFGGFSWIEVGILRRQEGAGAAAEPPRSKRENWVTPAVYHDFVAQQGWQLVRRGDAFGWDVQVNRVSGPNEKYRVVWKQDGESEGNAGKGGGEGFVEELVEGDRLVIWARARYPGWQCIVETVDVVVHFGF